MKLLGFYLGRHDSNISYFDGEKVHYYKSEREFGIKHHYANLKWVTDKGFAPDAVAFSDGGRNKLGSCPKGILWAKSKKISDIYKCPTFNVDHYYAHILSAWPITDVEDSTIGIAIDGKGDNKENRKVIMNPGDIWNAKVLEAGTGKSIGRFFAKVGSRMGLKVNTSNGIKCVQDYAGKVMGAQAYGEVLEENLSKEYLKNVLSNPYALLKKCKVYDFEDETFRNWLATAHNDIKNSIIQLFAEYKAKRIIYSGGVAQNTVINGDLFKKFDLCIPPHCYDGGISLGLVEFLRLSYKLDKFSVDGFPYWQNDCMNEHPSVETIKKVAYLLANGKIVGWFQGRGEVGPRALGNRSIFMSPTVSDGKNIINSRIKHREHWRPFAPSVDVLHASKYFDVKCSPYMLQTVKCLSGGIPSVTHVDGTSRVQTVSYCGNPVFSNLVNQFYSITGVPVLLNTSLNGGGQPIYSTVSQCRKFFKETDIDAMCCGDTLWVK